LDSLIAVLIITVLIVLNGLFVAAEFAIIGAPRAAIERRAAEGHPVARAVRQILHDPRRQDRFIATAQLGITLASLGLGMYGEHILAEWIYHGLEALGTPHWVAAHAVASVLAVTVLTYFHVVVGEMVPKSLALQQAERTALWITPPILWTKALLYPLVIGLNGLGNGILKLMGVERRVESAAHYHTAEELEFVVRESQEGGLLRGESGEIVRELFRFGDLTAGEVMVPRVKITGIPAGAEPGEAAAILRASRHTRYPVYGEDLDHIAGMIHIRDLMRLLLAGRPVQASNARSVPFVPQTAPLDMVLTVMRRERTQMAVVMDEHGGTAGLITMGDLCDEVVGEIEEDTQEPPEIYDDAGGHLHVSGTVRLDEVGERLGVELEHEEVDTVSGLVLALLGRPPAVGDVVEYDHVRFQVTRVEGHGVEECVVSLSGEDPSTT
jgi:magnesium and cobalt exporter, CNNM family